MLGRLSRPSSSKPRTSAAPAPALAVSPEELEPTASADDTDLLTEELDVEGVPPSVPPSPPIEGSPIGAPPTLEEDEVDDSRLNGLLSAVKEALGEPVGVPRARAVAPRLDVSARHAHKLDRVTAAPGMQSSRLALQPGCAPTTLRLQSMQTRVRMLPRAPVPTAPATDGSADGASPAGVLDQQPDAVPQVTAPPTRDAGAGVGVGSAPAPKLGNAMTADKVDSVASIKMQSSRLAMVRPPSGGSGRPVAPIDTSKLRALSACVRSSAATTDTCSAVTASGAPAAEEAVATGSADADGSAGNSAAKPKGFALLKRASIKETDERPDGQEPPESRETARALALVGAFKGRAKSPEKASALVGAFQGVAKGAVIGALDERSVALKARSDELKAKAEAAKADLKDAFSSRQAFVRFSKGKFIHAGKKLKRITYELWTTARSEHTVANALAPPEEDVLGDSLVDEQIIHIFWMMTLAELWVINMLSQGNDSDKPFPIFQIFILGLYTSLIVGVAGSIFKTIFKFCNKKRRREDWTDRIRRRILRFQKERARVATQRHEGNETADTSPKRKNAVLVRSRTGRLSVVRGDKSEKQLREEIAKRTGQATDERKQRSDPLALYRAWNQTARSSAYEERRSWSQPLQAALMPKRVARMRAEAERREEASIKVQGLARRRAARKELLRRRNEKGYDKAAVAMQKGERRRTARKNAKVRRAEKLRRDEAAATLQKVARGRSARKGLKQRDAAALKLQKVQRGRSSRKHIDKKIVDAELAATAELPSPPASPPEDDGATERSCSPSPSCSAGGVTERSDGDKDAGDDEVVRTIKGPPPKILRPNRYLARLASSASGEPLPDRYKLQKPLPAIESKDAGEKPAPATPAVEARPHLPTAGSEAIAVGVAIASPESDGSAATPACNDDVDADEPAGDGEPAASPLKSNRLLLRLAAKNAEATEDASPAAPANKLLLKAFGGAAAAGASSTVSGDGEQLPDVFKSNRFLAKFAGNVTGEGGDAGEDGDEAKGDGGGSRGKALWRKAKGIKLVTRSKISAEEAERIRRSKLVPFSRRYILLRWTIGWGINIAIFIMLALGNYVYGSMFGPITMHGIIMAWVAGLFQTFVIVEPAQVVGLVLLPSVANNKYVGKIITNCKEYGCI